MVNLKIFTLLLSLFLSKIAEIAVVGLQVCRAFMLSRSHRSRQSRRLERHPLSMLSALARYISAALQPLTLSECRQWSEDVVPTVAFNFRKVRKGNVTLKIWDVAGMPRDSNMPQILTSLCRTTEISLNVGAIL